MSIQVDRNKPMPMSSTAARTWGLPLGTVSDARKKLIANFSAKKVTMLQRATSKNVRRNGSFQEAVGSVLAMAQFFAVMPLQGVRSADVKDLRFTWRSFRMVYTGVMFFFTLVNAVMTVMFLAIGNIEFYRIVPVVFYLSNAYAILSFCWLGRSWPAIMQQWHEVEKQLPPMATKRERGLLAKRIKIMSIVLLGLSFFEHLMNIVAAMQDASTCKHALDPVENVMRIQLPHIFYFTSYTPVKAVIGKTINLVSTFVWTYMDLFVMIISVGLGSRFRQINECLAKHKGQVMPESFWMENRIYYRNICDLCETIDHEIGHITLVSFSNNLWFICVQLLFSLNPQPSMVHAIYFWYSLIFLILRTLGLSMCSARINDESKEPLKVFRVVPPESWCLEIKRFTNEVARDVVALSGLRFFYLTRTLVLSVAGTIITYELVLVQLHSGDKNQEKCNLL